MPGRASRFTIYDRLEAMGYFAANPANTFARGAEGENIHVRQSYPCMLYHPKGEQVVTVPGVWEQDKSGRSTFVGEQRELVNKIAQNEGEAAALISEGWHDHPAKAIRARVEATISASLDMDEAEKKKLLAAVPKIADANLVKNLEAEIAKLRAEKTSKVA